MSYPPGPSGPSGPGAPQPSYDPGSYSASPYSTRGQGSGTMSPRDERTWGMLAHGLAVVAMIASAGFLGFLASIAVYVIHRDKGPFVRAHSANSLNVQIMMFIWLVVVTVVYVVLGVLTLGIGFFVLLPLFFVPPVVAGIMHVIGAIKAYNGEFWDPPLTPRFVS